MKPFRPTLFLAAALAPALLAGRAPAAPTLPAKGHYAVVASAKTMDDAAWAAVGHELVRKYDARLLTWTENVAQVREALAKAMPNYVCFVARPEEAGRDFVVAVHRLTRRLDDDPYGDCLWGILTGYDADDALRIAQRGEPLVLKKVLSGTTGGKMGPFAEGAMFDEGKAGRMVTKTADGKTEETGCPADSTRSIVDYLNDRRPDAFITSGHATERDWQIGYSYKDGQLRCKDGQLFGLNTKGERFDVRSANPKVFLPVGNCLIGHVSGRDCMVTALIHTGGVVQMFGYIVPTWYGKGGWGIQDLFLGQPGRWTLAEAFFANTQAMLHEIRARFPEAAGVDFERYDMERRRNLLGELSAKHGVRDRDALGLLWDRDTVAFFGDPALDVRPANGDLAWDEKLAVRGNRYTLSVTATRAGTWPTQPLLVFLPHRIAEATVTQGADLKPVVTDRFVLVPLSGDFAAGDTVRIVFEAKRLAP